MPHPLAAELETLLHDQPTNPLRPPQIEEHTEELERLEAMAKAPTFVSGHNRGMAVQRSRQVRKFLDEHAPKPIAEGTRQNAVKALTERLMDEVIAPAMLTRAEMQRNPAGSVGKHLRQEASKDGKHAILTWKRGMRALDPQNADPDFTNVERFRREGNEGNGAATFMAGAQLPGSFAMTPQAKANFPFPDPPTSALELAKARERKSQRQALRRQPLPIVAEDQGHGLGQIHIDPERQATEQRRLKRGLKRSHNMSVEARQAAGDRLRQMNAVKRAARAGTLNPGTPPAED